MRNPYRPPPSAPERRRRAAGAFSLRAVALCAATLCAATVSASCAASLPPAASAQDVQARERALAGALAKLGGGVEVTVRPTSDGGLEVLGPAPVGVDLGSALFATQAAPRPADIDATFGQYCRLRGRPERTSHEGYRRVTYRGNERRSGAECTLVADLPRNGRWRFVLRIQRNVNPS